MIKLSIDKANNKIKIYDCNKDVEFELLVEEDGQLYYKQEDAYYSSLTSFVKTNIGEPKVDSITIE